MNEVRIKKNWQRCLPLSINSFEKMVELFLHLLIRWATLIYISRCLKSSPCNEDNSMGGSRPEGMIEWPTAKPFGQAGLHPGKATPLHLLVISTWFISSPSHFQPDRSAGYYFSDFSNQLGLAVSSHLLAPYGASEWDLQSDSSTLESRSVSSTLKDRYSLMTSS